jgi:hypothetical protein
MRFLFWCTFFLPQSKFGSKWWKFKDFGRILDYYVSNDYKHDLEFMQHCQAFYPINKDWPKVHMGWSATKTRVEGWIQINSYFEATHPRMAILITHWLEPFTIGSYFTQFNDDGQMFALAYANRFNNKTKAKCSSYEGECFAIVWHVSSFHYHIYHRPFTLVTNYHQPLKFLIDHTNSHES